MLTTVTSSSSWSICQGKYRPAIEARVRGRASALVEEDETDQLNKRQAEKASQGGQPAAPECHALVVNQNVIKYKLRCVSDCLIHLCQEHSLDQFQHREGPDCQLEVKNWERQANKIKGIIEIYSILLKLPPLEADLKDSHSLISMMNKRPNFSPLDARHEVLDLIENRLPGYCDSIDLLRCILRSNHMIGAIAAFSVIVRQIIDYNPYKLHEDLDALSATFAVAVRQQHEFRILQEWKV